MKKERINKDLLVLYKEWISSILFALLIATSIKSAIADWNDVPTGSMKPTILEGDRIFINKLAYDFKIPYTTIHIATWSNPQRGDIVVFRSPADGTRLVKRVVGLPGDEISLQNNKLYVNGILASYKSATDSELRASHSKEVAGGHIFNENCDQKEHPIMLTPSLPAMRSFRAIKVPKGTYFMMGDNRDNSADSRVFGFVPRKLVLGKALAIAVSRDHSFLHPRWDRFFRKLK